MGWSTRSLARRIFPTLARYRWSSRRMARYAIKQGWKYPAKVMQQDIREALNSSIYTRRVMDFSNIKRPPRRIMNEMELSQDRNYRILGRAKYRHTTTGKLKYPEKSFYTNELDTKEGLSQQYIDEQLWQDTDPKWAAEGFEVLEIQHFTGRPY